MSSPCTPGKTETRKSMSPCRPLRRKRPSWDAMLRDVEIGHHLDARDERGLMGRIERAKRPHQDAVDAEIDRHAGGVGMDVNVARLPLQSGADNFVDEPYDWGRVAAKGFEIDGLGIALLGLANKGKAEFRAHLLQHFLAVAAPLQHVVDRIGRADDEIDFAAAQEAQFLLQLEIVGAACRNHKQIALRSERRDAKAAGIGGGKTRERFGRESARLRDHRRAGPIWRLSAGSLDEVREGEDGKIHGDDDAADENAGQQQHSGLHHAGEPGEARRQFLFLLGCDSGEHLVEAAARFAGLDHLEGNGPEQAALRQGLGEPLAIFHCPVCIRKDLREIPVRNAGARHVERFWHRGPGRDQNRQHAGCRRRR